MPAMMNRCAGWLLLGCLCLSQAMAEPLDDLGGDPFLATLADALNAYGIDVTANLNHPDLARGRIDRPRLGRFPDLPADSLPLSSEIEYWEGDYAAANIGGIVVAGRDIDTNMPWRQQWLDSSSSGRIFITFDIGDIEFANNIAEVAGAYGFKVLLYESVGEPSEAGYFYATAAQRLALDTPNARRYRGEVTELNFLGERVRRDSDSIFRDVGNRDDRSLSRNEPEVFLKESLGDEFTRSTIREIIVPGGIALGETASIPDDIAAMSFDGNELWLHGGDGESWRLPPLAPESARALFDFAQRSRRIASDSIVDIDERNRVRMSSALRDTDVGYKLMQADTVPFDYVRNLDVIKSVIVDTDVEWFPRGDTLSFDTAFEVRFLSSNRMRIAITRVALGYEYEAGTGAVSHGDNWGPDARRLSDKLDYAGLGKDVAEVARYGGWIALFRALDEAGLPFLRGRYEFMKLDKLGAETPARY